MRASPAITNFNAGELSPLLDGRQDLDFYYNGCSVLENFIPTVQGPARYRPGTVYVDRSGTDSKSWLARFEFNYEQAFLLEFSDARLGFFSNRSRVTTTKTITNVTDNGFGFCRVTSSGHGFYDGYEVTISGVVGVSNANGTFTVVRVDANAFDISAAFSGAYASGGEAVGPYTISTPYTAASLENDDGSCALSRVQVGDVVYLAGGGATPRTLSRTGATSWTLESFDPDDGPFMDQNEDEAVTVYASAATGTVTLEASDDIFTQDHVGVLMRLEAASITVEQWEPTVAVSSGAFRRYGSNVYECTDVSGSNTGTVPPTHTSGKQKDGSASAWKEWEYLHSGYGVVRITAVTDGDTATATVLSRLPADVVGSGSPTWRWRFGAWGDHNEYPTRVALWRDRLVFAGVRHLWMSKAGDYPSFAPDEFGQQTTGSGITIRPASPDNNAIRWMHSADALLVGTASTEFAVREITSTDPVGPANIKADPQTADGGRAVNPIRVGDTVFFVQRAGRALRAISYDIQRDGMVSSDVTRRSEHITESGLIDMAYQHTPDSIIWAVRADGVLLGFTYEREQDVMGWHRHTTGEVESVQTLPSPDGTRDDVWLCVKRVVNGVTVRYIERLSDDTYLDSALSYSGAPATVISGLAHLRAETVAVVADGARAPDAVVSGDSITLAEAASEVQVGLSYTGKIRPMRLEAGSRKGSAQGKTKRISKVVVRLKDARGITVGPSFDDQEELVLREDSDEMDEVIPLYSGDVLVEWDGGYDEDGYLCIQQTEPFPATVIGLYPQVNTSDR